MGYLIFVLPAIILMMWAQHRVKSTFARGMQVPARMSGAATARHILDTNGLSHVDVVETAGMLSDHYDPSHRVVRLSHDVYHGRTASSVGIAAHEVGHALQHANHYAPLVIRNAAVPAAQFGGTAFTALLIAGFLFNSLQLVLLGVILYGGVVIFQLVNLPVEFDASNRAKRMLPEMGIVDAEGSAAVRSVLNAAAWTYVAATLQSILTIAYYLLIFTSRRD
ncbi:MAG: zinc metallopeptidase [Planctomyces sp.]|uniref:Peptidase membrane zinc metallopeptidase n=1 Tax=Rubinisphaera brasiliensis (strain ATCC 49424 / DSM 5305 / JCM 21570 / IAM 15109 / NBRC 103401 / IFAM 1448) TaxID=756272 RepID=F0SKZ3_RUBBR|nr:zinc metallopeptidase [Rubinisphaera brasiliensis]ADY59846.1 peptidase membrane zinc metallopeptidase [Rubinisphaera brasiliensis DSM 5305]MBB03853.1 zinc metallopeptidase [Planctomyces sp.]